MGIFDDVNLEDIGGFSGFPRKTETTTLDKVPEEIKQEAIEKVKKERNQNITTQDVLDITDEAKLPPGVGVPFVPFEKDDKFPPSSLNIEDVDRTNNFKIKMKDYADQIMSNVDIGTTYEPSDVLYYTYANDSEMTPLQPLKKSGIRKLKLPKYRLDQTEQPVGAPDQEDFRPDEDVYSGVVRVSFSTGKIEPNTGREIPLDVYIKVTDQSEEEFTKNMEDYRNGFLERRNTSVPEPLVKSSPNFPVEIENYGMNVKYKTNQFNDVRGLGESLESLYFKRSINKARGGIYDFGIRPVALGVSWFFGEGLPYILEGKERYDSDGQSPNLVEIAAEYLRKSKDGMADVLTLGHGGKTANEITASYLKKATPLEVYEGTVTWSDEDIAEFLKGEDEQFITKFLLDLSSGQAFTRAIRATVYPLFGQGLRQADKFVKVINGLEKPPKGMATGWKTGFEHWKDSLGKNGRKGRTEIDLKKEWTGLLKSKKTQFTNVAFSDYMKAHFAQKGTQYFTTIKGKLLKNKFQAGVNRTAFLKNDNMSERFSSFGGVFAEEFLGKEFYMPFAFITNFGGITLLNSPKYQRAVQNPKIFKKGTLLAPVEFAGGFGSGIDFMLYKITGRRLVSEAEYAIESSRLLRQNPSLSAEEVELELRVSKDIINPNSIMKPRESFVIADEKGEPVIVKKGDPLYDKVVSLADDMNRELDQQSISNIVGGFKKIRRISDKLFEVGQRMGGKKNPALDLHANFGDIVDMFTTRVYLENMAARVDYGRLRGLKLGEVEQIYQQNKKTIDALSKLTEEVLPYVSKSEADSEIRDFLTGVKTYLDNYGTMVDDVIQTVNTVPKVMKRLLNKDIHMSGNDDFLADESEEMDAAFRALHINELSEVDAVQKSGDRVEAAYIEQQKNLNSIVDNYIYGTDSVYSNAGSGEVFIDLINKTNESLTEFGTELFQPMLARAKNIFIEGAEVNTFFKDMQDVMTEGALSIDKMTYANRVLFDEIFETSLTPNVKKFREAIPEGLDIGIDPNSSNTNLYLFYLAQKESQTIDEAAMTVFEEFFDDLNLNAQGVVRASQVIKDRIHRLQRMKSGSRTQEQNAQLTKLLETENKIENLIKETDAVQKTGIFEEYKKAAEAYATYVAPSKYGFFFNEYEQGVLRVDKKIPVDPKTQRNENGEKIYKKGQSGLDKLTKLGNLIIEDPEVAAKALLKKIGEPVQIPDGQGGFKAGYAIVTATQQKKLEIIATRAIDVAVIARGQKKLDAQVLKKELPDNVDEFTDLQNEFKNVINGTTAKNINLFERLVNNNAPGMRAWTRKYNKDGSMMFSDDTLFYRDTRDPSKNTTLAQNVGENKRYYNYDQSKETLFGADLQVALKSNKKVLEEVKNYRGNIDKVNERVVESVNFETTQLNKKRQAVMNYLVGKGLLSKDAMGLEGIVDQKSSMDIYENITADASGANLQELKNFLLKDYKKLFSMKMIREVGRKRPEKQGLESELFDVAVGDSNQITKANPEEEVDKFINSVVLNSFAEKVLVPSPNRTRVIPVATDSSKSVVKQEMIIDTVKAQEELRRVGPIIREQLGDERYEEFVDIIEFMGMSGMGTSKETLSSLNAKGIFRGIDNMPTLTSTQSLLAKAFSWARGVVGGKWLAADASIRNLRLTDAGVIKTLLTANVVGENTVLDVLHDIAIKGQYTEDNAKRFLTILPEVLYQSQLEANFYEGNWYPTIEVGDEYTPDPELYGKPLVEVEMNELFGN